MKTKPRPAGGLVWGSMSEASRIIGADPRTARRVIDAAAVRTRQLPGMAHMQVCLTDVRAIVEGSVTTRATAS